MEHLVLESLFHSGQMKCIKKQIEDLPIFLYTYLYIYK